MADTTFQPQLGQEVAIRLNRDELVVRHPRTFRRMKTGDRVSWSTYWIRRRREGALEPEPVGAGPEPLASRAEAEGEGER